MLPDTSKLIIVCGLPGAGKTTTAKRLEAELHAVRLCPDEWMDALSINLRDEEKRAAIESLQWAMGQKLLRLGQVVIIEWGTWARSERDALRVAARSLGAKVELYYLSASLKVLFDRIRRRSMENPPIRREEVAKWMNLFQPPSEDEQRLFDRAVTILNRGSCQRGPRQRPPPGRV